MSEAGQKRDHPDGPAAEDRVEVKTVKQFYMFFVNGGMGPFFVKPGDAAYPDLSSPGIWALVSRCLPMDKSEVQYGNVEPMYCDSVVRHNNKITGINVGGYSVPPIRFENLSAISAGARKGARYVILCKDSYLAMPAFQITKGAVHIGTATVTFPTEGENLGDLYAAMGHCISTFGMDLPAGLLKALCEKAITVVNMAKNNMKFWTSELKDVLNAPDKTTLLSTVTILRVAPKVPESVLQLCGTLLAVSQLAMEPVDFLQILLKFNDPTMILPAITSYGKFPLPMMPKPKDREVLFTDERGTKLQVKKLSECNDTDVVLLNDAAIVAEGQILYLTDATATVFVKPPGADIFYKGKGPRAKYEKREWKSMAAKPIVELVNLLVTNGVKVAAKGKAETSGKPLQVDDCDDN